MVTEVTDQYNVSDAEELISVNDAPDQVSVVEADDAVIVVSDVTDEYVVSDSVDGVGVTDAIDSYEVVDAQIINDITINRPVADARVTVETGEDIGIYKVVTMVNGFGVLGDNTDSTHSRGVLGISEETIPSGFQISIINKGEIVNAGWTLTAGDPVYLSTAGDITQVIPTMGFLLRIGVATKTDTVLVDIQMPVHLH